MVALISRLETAQPAKPFTLLQYVEFYRVIGEQYKPELYPVSFRIPESMVESHQFGSPITERDSCS
jgi:hypothetical protein